MKIIKFYTDTCGPCKVMKPILDKLVSNHPELEYREINCGDAIPDEYVQIVRSVPTILIKREGKPYEKIVGIRSYEELEKLINVVE